MAREYLHLRAADAGYRQSRNQTSTVRYLGAPASNKMTHEWP